MSDVEPGRRLHLAALQCDREAYCEAVADAIWEATARELAARQAATKEAYDGARLLVQ